MRERFEFGLQRVRKVRVHAEDRAKEELAASVAQRLREEAKLLGVSDELALAHGAHPQVAAEPGAGVDAATLRHRQAYLERLERTRLVAALELDRADAEVLARRDVLEGASRRRQALDRLHDRQAATHAQALTRHQATVLDEIGLQTFVRNRAAS